MSTVLAKAAYRYFMAWYSPNSPNGMRYPEAVALDPLLGKDDPTKGPYTTGWVFTGERNGVPFREVEGTGKCAIVFYSYDAWAQPSQFQQNVAFPRLSLAIYADASRDASGNYTKRDGADRAEAIFTTLKPLFHDARNVVRKFDNLPIVSTLLGSGPTVLDVPDGDYAVMLNAAFNVQV